MDRVTTFSAAYCCIATLPSGAAGKLEGSAVSMCVQDFSRDSALIGLRAEAMAQMLPESCCRSKQLERHNGGLLEVQMMCLKFRGAQERSVSNQLQAIDYSIRRGAWISRKLLLGMRVQATHLPVLISAPMSCLENHATQAALCSKLATVRNAEFFCVSVPV